MSKQEVKNEVVKKAPPMMPAEYQHKNSVVHSEDIVVPKILLAQGLSLSVSEGKAKMGDFTNSLTGAVLGGPNQAVPFIPITLNKYWKRFEIVNKKKQYRGSEPWTMNNSGRPLSEQMPSRDNPAVMSTWEYDLTLDVLGFTEEDVQDPVALPTAISFTRTSYKAGQQVNTLLASIEAVKLPYYAYMLSVSCSKKQNDKGIFYVFDIKPKMDGPKMLKTAKEYYPKLEQWSQILNDKNRVVSVDDSDEAETTVAASVDESRF